MEWQVHGRKSVTGICNREIQEDIKQMVHSVGLHVLQATTLTNDGIVGREGESDGGEEGGQGGGALIVLVAKRKRKLLVGE